MPTRGAQFPEDKDDYSLPNDEKPKEPKWEREHPDETIHLRRRYQLPTTMSVEDYYAQGGYQYGKRPRKKK